MRVRLLALALAAAALVAVVLAVTAGAANSPQDTVRRFLQPRSIRDTCGVFTPDSRPRNPFQCRRRFYRGSPVTDLTFTHVAVDGNHAVVEVEYPSGHTPVEATFRLVKLHGTWLITFDR